jgi:hypothetical protein
MFAKEDICGREGEVKREREEEGRREGGGRVTTWPKWLDTGRMLWHKHLKNQVCTSLKEKGLQIWRNFFTF